MHVSHRWQPASTSPPRVAWYAGEKMAASSWFLPLKPPSYSFCKGSTCSGEVRTGRDILVKLELPLSTEFSSVHLVSPKEKIFIASFLLLFFDFTQGYYTQMKGCKHEAIQTDKYLIDCDSNSCGAHTEQPVWWPTFLMLLKLLFTVSGVIWSSPRNDRSSAFVLPDCNSIHVS